MRSNSMSETESEDQYTINGNQYNIKYKSKTIETYHPEYRGNGWPYLGYICTLDKTPALTDIKSFCEIFINEKIEQIISAYFQGKYGCGKSINKHFEIHGLGLRSPCNFPREGAAITNCFDFDNLRCYIKQLQLVQPYIFCECTEITQGQGKFRYKYHILRISLILNAYQEFLAQQEEIKKAEAERIEKQLAKYDRIGDRIADRLIARFEQHINCKQ